ncbi:uncharacterized protein LOC129796484 [Lutzomyia longipalpis]|uniref:uncharacterized protein LOC129796484 n=1 Tax=Lutzomyia longipalpis TaxID=7200 RepID=UPI0024844980|nr:uncharacterized protein LOC129796484 [Lutzomyia longipalpis]XP_055694443.1 uncharacterized protein LOC129796484 [Lutzomyia longipalpis]
MYRGTGIKHQVEMLGSAVMVQDSTPATEDCMAENVALVPRKNDFLAVSIDSQNNRMRVALGVLMKLLVPILNGVVKGWHGIRGIRILRSLRNLRSSRGLLTNLLAYTANSVSMSLSSVQVVHKIDPLLKMMKLKRGSALPGRIPALLMEEPEKCVTLNVLAEPPAGTQIRADVIFIHGLHGSLVNTWKQGMWDVNGRRQRIQQNVERPPRPPIRPPKRPRHSHQIPPPPHVAKRARHYSNPLLNDEEFENLIRRVCFEAQQNLAHCFNDESVWEEKQLRLPTFRTRYSEDDLRECPGTPPHAAPEDPSGEPYSKCWPRDWLPVSCPGVRVIALNYTTDPYLWRPVWVKKRNRTSLVERSREMTELLIQHRVGVGHPIVWVGHSKGGIFIKQIIVDAWESGRAERAPLWQSSRGILFYSVPHRGSSLADFNLPLLRQSVELTEIQKNCQSILELHRRFLALYYGGQLKIRVYSFIETALTLMSVLYLRIVGVDSADPGIGEVCGVHLDHREICKPRNRNCILYTELTKMINKVS